MKARIKLSFNDLRKVLSVWNRSFEIGRVISFDAFILLFFPIFFLLLSIPLSRFDVFHWVIIHQRQIL